MYPLALITLFLTTALAVFGIAQLASDASERSHIRDRNALAAAERSDRRLSNRLDRAFRRTRLGATIDNHLAGGGVHWRPLTFLAFSVAAAIAAFVLVDAVLPLWMSAPAGVGGGYAVWAFVERARRKRKERFLGQLPDIARMIASGSQAGLSLQSALELAASDLDEPAGEELQRVATQVRLGQNMETALRDMVARMPSRDVGVMVSTLVIQQRAGGDLVSALSDLSDALESRRQTAREIKVMLVGAVFTAYVIPVLVVGLLLILNLSTPGALEELTSSLLGRVVLVVSGTLILVGYLMIQRITKVER